MSSNIPACSGIYIITCTPTGKIYIGSAVNLRARRNHHFWELRKGIHGNEKLQRAWRKYGEQAFVFEILEFVLLPAMLTAREQYYFDTLQPFGNIGFNMTPIAGSTLGRKFSNETKEKLRIAQLGRKHTEEHKQKAAVGREGRKHTLEALANMSAAQMGNTNGRGKKLSPEHREKLRLASLGKKHSEERSKKMSKIRTGKIQSPETIEKKRLALIGGKRTPETRAKMSVSGQIAKADAMKTIIVTSPEGIEYEVVGIRPFCREHQLDRSTLMRVAKGKNTHHKGWKARFPD